MPSSLSVLSIYLSVELAYLTDCVCLSAFCAASALPRSPVRPPHTCTGTTRTQANALRLARTTCCTAQHNHDRKTPSTLHAQHAHVRECTTQIPRDTPRTTTSRTCSAVRACQRRPPIAVAVAVAVQQHSNASSHDSQTSKTASAQSTAWLITRHGSEPSSPSGRAHAWWRRFSVLSTWSQAQSASVYVSVICTLARM